MKPNIDNRHFYLYHTLGCHLCEQAEAILAPLATRMHFTYAKVDIADDDSLVDIYGIRIPVLLHGQSGSELGWPFDHGQALDFLQSCLENA